MNTILDWSQSGTSSDWLMVNPPVCTEAQFWRIWSRPEESLPRDSEPIDMRNYMCGPMISPRGERALAKQQIAVERKFRQWLTEIPYIQNPSTGWIQHEEDLAEARREMEARYGSGFFRPRR